MFQITGLLAWTQIGPRSSQMRCASADARAKLLKLDSPRRSAWSAVPRRERPPIPPFLIFPIRRFRGTNSSALGSVRIHLDCKCLNPPRNRSLCRTYFPLRKGFSPWQVFWDGGVTWRLRFTPVEVGEWRFRTHSDSCRGWVGPKERGVFLSTVSRNQPLSSTRTSQILKLPRSNHRETPAKGVSN
jgi:Domain of unknown function (DUF5060)